MLKITYQFSKEYSGKIHIKEVCDLNELEDFIFKTGTTKTDDKRYMQIPTSKETITSINFWVNYDKGQCYIHQVENENGIIFSDGKFTSTQQFMSDGFLKFCNDCHYKAVNKIPPKYNFVNDNAPRNDESFYKKAFNDLVEGYIENNKDHLSDDLIFILIDKGYSSKELVKLGFDRQDIKYCKEVDEIINFADEEDKFEEQQKHSKKDNGREM